MRLLDALRITERHAAYAAPSEERTAIAIVAVACRDFEATLREIAHTASNLPHARRRDRDFMRELARDALSRAENGQAGSE